MKFEGIVLDEFNKPIEDVNIYFPELAGNIGTYSNADGMFSIYNDLITNETKVVISHVSYKTIQGTVRDLNNRILTMEYGVLEGDEVIVTGSPKPKPKKKFCWLCLLLLGAGVTYAATREEKPKK